MQQTMLEQFRSLEKRFYFVLALFVVAVLAIVLLYYAYTKNITTFTFTTSDYAILLGRYNATLTQLDKLAAVYNSLYTNVSTPYTRLLYGGYTVNIPKKNVSAIATNITYSGPTEKVNSTYVVTYYTYGFSFNASYPGYLQLNATGTVVNSQANDTWEFIIAGSNIIPNATMKYYNYQVGSGPNPFSITTTGKGVYRTNFDQNSQRVIYAPTPAQGGMTINIPVGAGQNYVWIANFNNQSISVTFSAKYFGQRTR